MVTGSAHFKVDGEEFDAPAGTFVYVPDPKSERGAVAGEPGTVLFAVGGEPGCVYTPSEWDRGPLSGPTGEDAG